MTLQDYLMSFRDIDDPKVFEDDSYPLAKRITCADGFSLSVQASHGAYCRPRTNIAVWNAVEVGYPSDKPEFFSEYAEGSGWDDPETGEVAYYDYTNTVYGYVPIELVEKCIALHGGMVLNNLLTAPSVESVC